MESKQTETPKEQAMVQRRILQSQNKLERSSKSTEEKERNPRKEKLIRSKKLLPNHREADQKRTP